MASSCPSARTPVTTSSSTTTTSTKHYHGQVDFFAVYCRETTGVYLVPITDLEMDTHASLRVQPTLNNQRKGVRFAADYEIVRVAIEGLRGPSGA
jgi:hypothetical protein